MSRRILILPFSAVVIVLVCLCGINRKKDASLQQAAFPVAKRSAQTLLFELYDQNNKTVRLERYLGRHSIILVFFDQRTGADGDPVLLALRENAKRLNRENVIVLGVSTALPQDNRKRIEERQKEDPDFDLPFLLLTDLPPECRVHRQWGRFDEAVGLPLPGLFYIDRAGNVDWAGRFPKPVSDVELVLDSRILKR
jgi:peroxiredoxin